MADQGRRRSRPTLGDNTFEKVGTFETLEDGTILPTLSTTEAQPTVDLTDFQGGSPAQA